jgi:RNA polymerase sigma-B factor
MDYYETIAARLARVEPDRADRAAVRSEVIEGFLPLADRLARRYTGRGQRLDDLVQVARLGLVKAVDGFDPALGTFVGYAIPTIRGELKRYFRDQCWDIRVPRRLQELRMAVNDATDALAQQLGHLPNRTELAADVGASEDEVDECLEAGGAFSALSLNAPCDEQGSELAEQVGAADTLLDEVPEWVSLRPALDQLPQRERDVLVMRFFLNMTQARIAEHIGVSQMHVSRLLSRTLRGLREWIDGDTSHVQVCEQRIRHADAESATG